MANVILFEDYETYRTRHFIFKKGNNQLQNELSIEKYSFLAEIINLDFCQLKKHILSDNDFSLKCELVDNKIDNYIKENKNIVREYNFAKEINKALGTSLINSNCISSNSASIISYIISSFFSKLKRDDFSKKTDSKHFVILALNDLQNIIKFIKNCCYDGIIDIDKCKSYLKSLFNKASTTLYDRINIYALFNDEAVAEFIEKFNDYHKNIDFFYEKVKNDNEESLRSKIINAYYNDQHSDNPKIESIFDLELNDNEIFNYFELIYQNQQILKKYNIYQFFDFSEYFEIIFQSMIQNKRRLKKCPNCNNFFITDYGKKGNAQKYCIKCRNIVDITDIKRDAYKFNDKYKKKLKSLNSIKNNIENFNNFTDCLEENILEPIKNSCLDIAKSIDNCDDYNKQAELISIYKNWKSSNDNIYKKGYIKNQYQNSKLSNSVYYNESEDFKLQYYKLNKDFTIVLISVVITKKDNEYICKKQ